MWGGLLKSIVDSDLHIILDVVKSSKNSRYNRNKIAGNGEPIWLTIPFVEFKREKLIRNQNLDTSTITKNKLLSSNILRRNLILIDIKMQLTLKTHKKY